MILWYGLWQTIKHVLAVNEIGVLADLLGMFSIL